MNKNFNQNLIYTNTSKLKKQQSSEKTFIFSITPHYCLKHIKYINLILPVQLVTTHL